MRGRQLRFVRNALCVALIVAVMPPVGADRTGATQKQSLKSTSVELYCDGVRRQVVTSQQTVGAILEEAGVTLNPADQVYPSLDAKPFKGKWIRVTRVVEKVVVQDEPVAFTTVRRPSRLLRPGQTRTMQDGSKGEKRKTYNVIFKDGVPVSRKLLAEEFTAKPKDKIVLVGDRRLSSRGFYTSRRVMKMQATAYDPGPRSCGRYATGYTATGMKAGYGVVAVDPRVISLGTRLYIDGYGFAIAGDVGKAIKGHRIDLGFDTYHSAKKFGRKQVTVHILN